jgi:hypothetical protein
MCCAGYTNLGCYVYNTKGHTGSTDVTSTSAGKMSPAECYRLSAAYDFFGLVNGKRCLGFTSLRQAAVAAPLSQDGNGSSCLVPCSGAANTTCGGPSTMQLYARNKPVPQLAPVSGEEQVCRGVGAKGGGSLTSGRNFRTTLLLRHLRWGHTLSHLLVSVVNQPYSMCLDSLPAPEALIQLSI